MSISLKHQFSVEIFKYGFDEKKLNSHLDFY